MINMSHDRLYLTSTGRLSRNLRRHFRLQCISEGKRGWESLRAMSLNAWLDRTWMESWPEEIPAPDLYRMNLWKKLAGRIVPLLPLPWIQTSALFSMKITALWCVTDLILRPVFPPRRSLNGEER